jgi:hypothetical protein
MVERVLVSWLGNSDLNAAKLNGDDLGALARIIIAQFEGGQPFHKVLLLHDYTEDRIARTQPFGPDDVVTYEKWLKDWLARHGVESGHQLAVVAFPVRLEQDRRTVDGFYDAAVMALGERNLGDPKSAELWFNVSSGMPYMQFAQMLLARTKSDVPRLLEADKKGGVRQIGFLVDFKGELVTGVQQAITRTASRAAASAVELGDFSYRSEAMRRLMADANVLRSWRDANVLVVGEAGTQTREVAALIVALNPDAIFDCRFRSADLEKKLWGGNGPLAQGKPVLLVDVDGLSRDEQRRTVSILKTRRAQGNQRVIATTTVDPRSPEGLETFEPAFLFEVFHRTLVVDPLRKLQEDILPLARRILEKLAEKFKLNSSIDFDVSAENTLRSYRWPYNLIELQRVISEIVVRGEYVGQKGRSLISAKDINDRIMPVSGEDDLLYRSFDETFDLDRMVWEFKAHYFVRAMLQAGNRPDAGRLLYISKGVDDVTKVKDIQKLEARLKQELGEASLAATEAISRRQWSTRK